MLKVFIIIASFEAADQPAARYGDWTSQSLEHCERNLNDLLYRYKVDFDVNYIRSTNQRVFVTSGLGEYVARETRLQCVEVIAPSQ